MDYLNIINDTTEKCVIDFNKAKEINKNFLGLGFEWDITDDYEYTNEEKERLYKAIEEFNPPIIRCLYRASIYIDSDGNYNFNTSKMQELMVILDYCELKKITVMLGEWDRDADVKCFITSDDPKWAKAIAKSLEYLIIEQGYSCIKYFNYVNEPNGDWAINEERDNWTIWSNGIDNLHKELVKSNLIDKITIAGPDSTFADSWIDKCVDGFPEKIGCYEFHKYAFFNEVSSGAIEKLVAQKREYILNNDEQGARKLFVMGEAGLIDGKNSKDQQKNVASFEYGLYMSNYIIQCIRGGMDGAILWMLDDCMHNAPNGEKGQYKEWGLFSSLEKENRPWYYPMTALSKCFYKINNIEIPYTHGNIKVVMGKNHKKSVIAIVNNSYMMKETDLIHCKIDHPYIYAYTPYNQNDKRNILKVENISKLLIPAKSLLIIADFDIWE